MPIYTGTNRIIVSQVGILVNYYLFLLCGFLCFEQVQYVHFV